MRVAIVGAGISGLAAAYLLRRTHEVELFERNDYFGGHSNTIAAQQEGQALGLDTGFVVYNEAAYPGFSRLLAELRVPTQTSDMSFAVSCRACRVEFSSRGLKGLVADHGVLVKPARWRLGWDVARFYRDGPRSISDPEVECLTLAGYLKRRGFSGEFRRHFILPLAAAVWSMAPGAADDFPAKYFLRFVYNHGLIGNAASGRWRWRTVVGGSRRYVEAVVKELGCGAHAAAPVRAIRRRGEGAVIDLASGESHRFDAVVLACHADEARALLADASPEEEAALDSFSYGENRAVLHTDPALLPRRVAARASWNYITSDCRREGAPLALTYHLNRLQSIWRGPDYCVSVNPEIEPRPETVLREMVFSHPQYSFRTLEGQRLLEALQGRRRTFFAGAHLGYGFHEDGFASALRVAARLGVAW